MNFDLPNTKVRFMRTFDGGSAVCCAVGGIVNLKLEGKIENYGECAILRRTKLQASRSYTTLKDAQRWLASTNQTFDPKIFTVEQFDKPIPEKYKFVFVLDARFSPTTMKDSVTERVLLEEAFRKATDTVFFLTTKEDYGKRGYYSAITDEERRNDCDFLPAILEKGSNHFIRFDKPHKLAHVSQIWARLLGPMIHAGWLLRGGRSPFSAPLGKTIPKNYFMEFLGARLYGRAEAIESAESFQKAKHIAEELRLGDLEKLGINAKDLDLNRIITEHHN